MDFFADNHWITWILVGGIAGALAKLVMPGKDPGGIIVTILLGIAGALLVGYAGAALNMYEPGEGPGFFAAFFGAVVLLVIYRLFNRRRV